MNTSHLPGSPTAVFDDVDILAELIRRTPHARNQALEDRCFSQLAEEMAQNPRNMLQKLVETALEYCTADTAGISILETQNGKEVFRWEALAGVFASQRNNTMPRGASPCGVTIDKNSTQLMYLADRAFPALKADPPFIEALLIPFHIKGEPVGTVWVVSHTANKGFDCEDERFIKSLGQFASAGWQLWKSNETLEFINRSKDEFVAMISHELRTPLNVIFTASNLLLSNKLSTEQSTTLTHSIQRNAKLQQRILNDLLYVTKLDIGALKLELGPVDLSDIVIAAIAMVNSDAERKSIAISFVSGTSQTVEADAMRIQQVLGNLLVNAVKFTPDYGKIDILLSVSGEKVRITVKDSGIGIPEEFLPHVFEKFRQKDPGTPDGSLGLGLAIARALIEAHNGKIVAESEGFGKGTVFTIVLPLSQSSAESPNVRSSKGQY